MFTQSQFLDYIDSEMLSGRIYLNQKIISLKSKEENAILTGLKEHIYSKELIREIEYKFNDEFEK